MKNVTQPPFPAPPPYVFHFLIYDWLPQSVMGTLQGMMTSTPPDPSHKIPPEARGKVRRKKKSLGAGAVTRTSSAGGGGEDVVAGDGEGGGGKDRTFVTSREFPEEQKSSVG